MANLIKRGNSFRIRVSLGFDGNVKRIVKTKTYNPPANMTPKQAEKEAERQAVLFEEQCRTGQILDNSTRFAEFSEIWLHDYAEKHLKATTLLLFTGMRRGELCGLEWQDVDFKTNCLHIQRNSLYIAEKGIFEDEPKNETSKRVIKLSNSAVQLLKDYKEWQDAQKAALGTAWEEHNRLFTAWNGKPIRPDSITAWFHEFILRSGLPSCSIHSLRHTNATLLIANGTPIKTVSKRLGHANAATTSNIYLHAIQSADEAAAETLEDILSPRKREKTKAAE